MDITTKMLYNKKKKINASELPLIEKENMLTKTYISSNIDKELLDKLILTRKEEKVSQQELANRIGIKQQTIPRTE